MIRLLTFAAVLLAAAHAFAQESQDTPAVEPAMTLERLGEIIAVLDPDAEASGNAFRLTISDVPVTIITDPGSDRMRALVPIRSVEGMPADEILRVMQANFDTALDARYAIAQGRLWAVFIHPLAALERDQFISGMGQTVNLALTYGSLYTGGALSFGGGDSVPLQRQLIDDLLDKGQDI